MTREEALEQLRLGPGINEDVSAEYNDAVEVAIEALEHPEKNVIRIVSGGDAISRQAVLKMAYDMSEIDGEHFTEPCMVVDVEDIQKLPSVNPQPKTGHWIMHPIGIYAHLVCDNCLASSPYNCHTNYCPCCGRRMVELPESEEV